ncbi:unnamed protein product [Blepharisma stoltei]|uniref:Uroporphyrinogen decarboxylase n=1 Tax=Blepharisma stoltei TaxID=1481888 RepID=A0AAU9K350_9CILI|nr:unnamed protein product [Blepharisma stoltei]
MELQPLDSIPQRISSSEYKSLHTNTGFPAILNDRILKAAHGEEVDKIPIWIMRQAGRYLEEFRNLRVENEFFRICTTPRLACEVTLLPINLLPLDAAIIFSDILVIPQTMGMEVIMEKGKGPVFTHPLQTPEDINLLKIPDISTDYEPYLDAIFLTRHSLLGKVPLIGFCGGPFTLFTYMIEGQGSTVFTKSRRWIYQYPQETHRLLDMLTNILCDFLLAQICSGAQMLQIFESHAGILGPDEFEEFLLSYNRKIASFLKEKAKINPGLEAPLIIFCKDAGYALESICQTEFDIIQIDWTVPIPRARELANRYGKVLQGNLDPAALYASGDFIRQKATKMVETFGKEKYICNLGHGIYPDTDPEKLRVYLETVHSL